MNALQPLSQSETASLSERVYRRLRDAIAMGSLAPRTRVSERGLAARLGVSPAPVRESLRRLEMEGLVVTLPRRGTLVADFGPGQLEEMGRIRVALEAVVAGLAARNATPEDIARLAGQLDAMRAATGAGDAGRLAEANTRFHEMIRAMAGNAMLETTLRSLRGYDQVGRQRSLAAPGEFTRALVEHTELLDALRLGDQDRAELLMRAHGLRSLRQASQHPAPPQASTALNEDGMADGLAPAGPDGSSQNGPDHNRRTT
ncbi:putative HTH-type transcriptional regulator YdfH [Roseomonas sp. TAS13]|uniref:GntR family transcriptional regulator n=1 Tax=Roseomonas mucosa TaxID=207340 RepID=A0A1S8DA72_9PROT|nr:MULTISPECIES: GntR family transcriptional regulator [Roseomonas]ONH84697.1 GntR family transcriptional regulator [Roseomonas mucosa]USQ71102.1 GntR family transcriptional regulator [Roseomonas mucosa]GAV32513.1 putative HTH-type transcriptional regulator YdfH [Roseomonas sp. TAS13]